MSGDGGEGMTVGYIFARQCGISKVLVPQATPQELIGTDHGLREEQLAISEYVKKGGEVWVSAGNSRVNLSKMDVYPANYKDVHVVGATNCATVPERALYSNYGGNIKYWECGDMYGGAWQGTSFAMPRYVGALEKKEASKFKVFPQSVDDTANGSGKPKCRSYGLVRIETCPAE